MKKLNTLLLISMTLISLLLTDVTFAQNEQPPGNQAAEEERYDDEETKEKKEKKKKDSFKVFAGVSFNTLNLNDEVFESTLAPGYMLGFSYLRGRFFYWEIGARYNNYSYNLKQIGVDSTEAIKDAFGVRAVDVPITGGINVLSFVSRIVGLRIFVSAVPTFNLGVGSNDLNITKDDINSFVMNGQAGIGVDVAFIFLEVGGNYGFNDLLKNDIQSNPVQGFVNLGFRF